MVDGLRDEGFIKPDDEIDAEAVLAFLRPMIEPVAVDEFRFTRAWLRGEATRLSSPRSPAYQLSRKLNLPPSYLLIHRVTLGSIGVLCQLEAKAPTASIVAEVAARFRPGRLIRTAARRGSMRRWTPPRTSTISPPSSPPRPARTTRRPRSPAG